MGNSISSYSEYSTIVPYSGSVTTRSAPSHPLIIQQTGGNDNTPLEKTLDYIASHYILTMDFQSLRKLHEKEYCEELIGLTSKIIDKHFNDLEVNQLLNRIKNDGEDEDDKQTKCNQIAKFYIKIAHIFSAIVTTVNPEYVYEDSTGNIQKHTLNNKNEIPDGSKISVSKLNLCGERISALRGASSDLENDLENGLDKDITIHPEICSINMDKSTLEDEPGIPELIDLYYDDDYDYKTGKFLGMSESTKEQYQEDLKRFYLEFTGSKELSKEISKFGDIKLKDYSKQPYCENSQSYTGKYKDKLFSDYANNLKKMVQSVNENQTKLLDIINDLFVYVDDPVTKQKIVRVNPELNNDTLQEVVEKSRNVIIELYLQCEGDFAKGVKLYEAIVESQIFETSKRQIVTLNNAAEKLYMTT